MKKLSFSIPSGKPQSKPEPIHNTFNDSDSDSDDSSNSQNGTDSNDDPITEFDPSKPTNPKITIPPLHNQWNPQQHSSLLFRRTPSQSELLRKHKLNNDLHSLPDHQGFQEFSDVPIPSFGAALLAGYGWTKGMGIGKNAKEDVKVVQFKRGNAGQGLGFVRDDAGAKLDQCSHDLSHFQL